MFSASKTSGPSGYNLTNSLRFRASASAFLNRTPASAGNQQKFTWSGWVKRGQMFAQSGNSMILMSAGTNSATNNAWIYFNGDNIAFFSRNNSTISADVASVAVSRDPSAWYHIVCAVDSTQGNSGDRVKIYINGVQQTLNNFTTPTLNFNTVFNTTIVHNIARDTTSSSFYFDGYMDEINFIDGQQLTPSSFGSTNATTGVWQPARYTGTYGTNGFYLNFTDIGLTSGSNTGLGRDFSGNGNFWNTNNISVTAGATYDAMTDVPTLTSATVANYAVMNPLWRDGTTVIAQGNLDVSNGNYGGFSTLTIPTNSRFYAEFTVTATQGNQGVGLLRASAAYSGVISQTDMFGSNAVTYYSTNGNRFVLGGGSTAYGASWGTIGDVIGIAVNTVDNQITFYKNNVSQGVITGLTSGIEWVFATGNQTNTGGGAWNFGQRPFAYTPPTGFLRLNTFNLPTSTIVKGNTVMDATLYTGNNTGQTITNAGSFRPDFLWIKVRTNTYDHTLADSVRGVSAFLASNTTAAEGTNSELTSFNSNGFTLGATGSMARNVSGQNYVAWQWQAGQGTNTTNTAGSITSTVSVNATAGFSIVTYSGTNSDSTVGHGLGVAPKMYVIKQRNSTGGWVVYHSGLPTPATNIIYLHLTNAVVTGVGTWNSTNPTSTVFSVDGNDSQVNQSGSTYVAYCWAEIAGFSKFGSYTGNGSADGPFIFTGFRPKYILVKITSTTDSWAIHDTSRSPYNTSLEELYPNLANAESTGASNAMDILSNGFKLRGTSNNTNGATFIYAAFAENPFKNALAR